MAIDWIESSVLVTGGTGSFVIKPSHSWWCNTKWDIGKGLFENYEYTSDKNTEWLSVKELREMAEIE